MREEPEFSKFERNPYFKKMKQEQIWKTFINGVNSFTVDFMAKGRDQGEHQEREP